MTRHSGTVLVVGEDGEGLAGRSGWSVRRADTVAGALEALSPAVDCVVSGHELAEETGLALFESVRERSDVPFVLRPAAGDGALASRALAAGVDAYVPRGASDEGAESLPEAVDRVTAPDGTAGRAGPSARERDDSGSPSGRPDSAGDDAIAGGVERGVEDGIGPVERDRQLSRYETILETVPDVIWTVDGDGQFTYVNTGTDRVYGIPRAEIIGQSVFDVVEGIEWSDPEDEAALAAGIRSLLDGERDRVKARGAFPVEDEEVALDVHAVPLESDGEVVGAAGVNRDVTRQRRRERRLAARQRELSALHGTARALLEAETRHEMSSVVVEAAREVLELPGVVVYLYESEADELVPAAHTGDKDRLYGRLPPVAPGEGITGHAYLQDETTVYDNVHDSLRLMNEAAEVRSGLFVPLGEHGVLIAGTRAAGAFDEESVERAELLAANAEAALDRAERERALRARDRTVQQQNRRLERLETVNEKIRRIDQALVGADTREQIERTVCEELVDGDRFALAWIGGLAGGELSPRSIAGDQRGYLDRVTPFADGDASGGEAPPPVRAADSGEPVTVTDVAEGPRGDPWRREALRREFRAVTALPLQYDGVDYGVLSIYATRPDSFDDLTRAVLDELSDTIAYAIHAVEQRAALMSEHRLECEFEVEVSGDPLASLAAEAETAVTVEAVTPRDDGQLLAFATVPGEATDALLAATDRRPTVSDAEVLADGETARLRLVLETFDVVDVLAATAGRPESVVVRANGSARVTVALPTGIDVTEYADRLAATFGSATLVARRQTPVGRAGPRDGDGGLTDRQREVLTAAYHAGFFEWPRTSTGEEVAEGLGISQPGFLKHIRTGERKLVTSFLEGGARE